MSINVRCRRLRQRCKQVIEGSIPFVKRKIILLNLSPELEAKLRQIAASSGKSIEAVAAEILGELAPPGLTAADDSILSCYLSST
jgi:hypothetical protein